ncbi:MAG: hypothetical protein IT453_03740 [Planctomycetes bacterium]|nr:hypothetical protein [Planctomycetota bacterium]
MNYSNGQGCETKRFLIDSKLVDCRRLERPLTVGEHLKCPYCFGTTAQVASGQRDCFCDFKKGRDPVHFGFPEENVRDIEG